MTFRERVSRDFNLLPEKERRIDLLVTMENGEVWSVPAAMVALNRFYSYADTDPPPDGEDPAALYAETLADDCELTDWAAGNMNWKDLSWIARRITTPHLPDYQEGWVNGDKEVRRRDEGDPWKLK